MLRQHLHLSDGKRGSCFLTGRPRCLERQLELPVDIGSILPSEPRASLATALSLRRFLQSLEDSPEVAVESP